MDASSTPAVPGPCAQNVLRSLSDHELSDYPELSGTTTGGTLEASKALDITTVGSTGSTSVVIRLVLCLRCKHLQLLIHSAAVL